MARATEIDCPRARSAWTPCIARDGSTALTNGGLCVGCERKPGPLLEDLAKRVPTMEPPAPDTAPVVAADRLRREVASYVDLRTENRDKEKS